MECFLYPSNFFFKFMHLRSSDGKCPYCRSETAIVAQIPDHTNSWRNRSAIVSLFKGGGALLFHYSEPAFLNNYINSSNIKELQKSKTTHVHCKITLKPSYDIHFNKWEYPSLVYYYKILIQTNPNWVKYFSVLGWLCSWTT